MKKDQPGAGCTSGVPTNRLDEKRIPVERGDDILRTEAQYKMVEQGWGIGELQRCEVVEYHRFKVRA